MTINDYVNAIESKRTCDCEGVVFIRSYKPWGIRWTCGAIDPFTEESPITSYFTSAEAIRAASSNCIPYDPADYPKVTEPISQDHTLESIRIDIQAACQVACIVRDKMPHDAYRDELSRIATALAELCNDVSRLEMAEIPAKAFIVPRGWESVES